KGGAALRSASQFLSARQGRLEDVSLGLVTERKQGFELRKVLKITWSAGCALGLDERRKVENVKTYSERCNPLRMLPDLRIRADSSDPVHHIDIAFSCRQGEDGCAAKGTGVHDERQALFHSSWIRFPASQHRRQHIDVFAIAGIVADVEVIGDARG